MRNIAVIVVFLMILTANVFSESISATTWSLSGLVAKTYTTTIPGVTLRIDFASAPDAEETAVYYGASTQIPLPNWQEFAVARIFVDIDPYSPTSKQKLQTNWEFVPGESRVVYSWLSAGKNIFRLDLLGIRKSQVDLPIGHIGTGKKPVIRSFSLEFYVQELEGDTAAQREYFWSRYAAQGIFLRREKVKPITPVIIENKVENSLADPPAVAEKPKPVWAIEFVGFDDETLKFSIASISVPKDQLDKLAQDGKILYRFVTDKFDNGNRAIIFQNLPTAGVYWFRLGDEEGWQVLEIDPAVNAVINAPAKPESEEE